MTGRVWLKSTAGDVDFLLDSAAQQLHKPDWNRRQRPSTGKWFSDYKCLLLKVLIINSNYAADAIECHHMVILFRVHWLFIMDLRCHNVHSTVCGHWSLPGL